MTRIKLVLIPYYLLQVSSRWQLQQIPRKAGRDCYFGEGKPTDLPKVTEQAGTKRRASSFQNNEPLEWMLDIFKPCEELSHSLIRTPGCLPNAQATKRCSDKPSTYAGVTDQASRCWRCCARSLAIYVYLQGGNTSLTNPPQALCNALPKTPLHLVLHSLSPAPTPRQTGHNSVQTRRFWLIRKPSSFSQKHSFLYLHDKTTAPPLSSSSAQSTQCTSPSQDDYCHEARTLLKQSHWSTNAGQGTSLSVLTQLRVSI